ncbi:MAG: site-specific integrase [Lachnospiraceae bacterium]|nr:site-specific integrase [Lachnospiraceae bacterium]
MENNTKELETFEAFLHAEELSERTRAIYLLHAKRFLTWLDGRKLTKQEVMNYKETVIRDGKKTATVNLAIIALNRYLRYAGYEECTVRALRVQKPQCPDNILSLSEYRKMMVYARQTGQEKYYCIMRTLALTGIRVSELSGCTVEAVGQGSFEVENKGKRRNVYLPRKLTGDLKQYCMEEHIDDGVIFRGSKGQPISRIAVYKMLVRLAQRAGVPWEKAHPHSFRHLFAITYMEKYSNLTELADILGHSSMETTRIYTTTSAEDKRRRMNELDL